MRDPQVEASPQINDLMNKKVTSSSDFNLCERHIKITSTELVFFTCQQNGPVWDILKDINLFPRQVYLKLIHSGATAEGTSNGIHNEQEVQALEDLISLMDNDY